MYRWFHIAVFAISAVLLLTSGLFFYLSDPWLTVVPVFLFGLSLIVFRLRQGNRTTNIIKRATEIQVRMEREGSPQTEINKAIYLGATGNLYTQEPDFDLKFFLKYFVLREVIGFDAEEDFTQSLERSGDPTYISPSDKIDASVDSFYQHWCKVYDRTEQLKR
jgi:hypothetical protein